MTHNRLIGARPTKQRQSYTSGATRRSGAVLDSRIVALSILETETVFLVNTVLALTYFKKKDAKASENPHLVQHS
jgi:hypothetical protein